MKSPKTKPQLINFLLVILFATISISLYLNSSIKPQTSLDPSLPNSTTCLSDDCLAVDNLQYPVSTLPTTVVEALSTALQDEYKALSLYQLVTTQFGMVRPFAMILGAEEQHIAMLKAIFDKYGLSVPSNDWVSKLETPESIKSACQMGVDAEIANAALYRDKLIPIVVNYPDITTVFNNLMLASETKHLPAFDRCN